MEERREGTLMLQSKLIRFLGDSDFRFEALASRGLLKWTSDKKFIEKQYYHRFHKKLDLDNPVSFNEKLQWIKINMRDPVYTKMADKLEAKKYVENSIGNKYIIPTIGVWNEVKDINFSELPNQYVLKCTHNSGGIIICRDKEKLDVKEAKEKLGKCLKQNYYWSGREWPYKNITPRIIAEKYMQNNDDVDQKGLIDYKFYCFNGTVKYLYVSQGLENHNTARISFLTLDWTFAPFKRSDYKSFETLPAKPSTLEEMINLAENLSQGQPFLRVDLYEINGEIYFSELTFTPCNGYMPFDPPEWDIKLGKYIDLPI